MEEAVNNGIETGHMEADDILCEVVETLGEKEGADIVGLFKKMGKWYA